SQAIQNATAKLLSAINAQVVELVRDLEAIKERQPWRLMPLEWGLVAENVRVHTRLGQPPVYLSRSRSELLDAVDRAKKHIIEMKNLLWAMKPKDADAKQPPQYIEELTTTYNQLQTELIAAQHALYQLSDFARTFHQNLLDKMKKTTSDSIPDSAVDPNTDTMETLLSDNNYENAIKYSIYQDHLRDWSQMKSHLSDIIRSYTINLDAKPTLIGDVDEKRAAPIRPSVHIIPDEESSKSVRPPWMMFNEQKSVTWTEAALKILTISVLIIIPILFILFVAILVVKLIIARKESTRHLVKESKILYKDCESDWLPTNKNKKLSARNKLVSRIQSTKMTFGTNKRYELVNDLEVLAPVAKHEQNGYENPSLND
ncbi:hypothetical protein Ciccas_012288, partial [Cichlidogyrus casuarinus]